MERLGGRPLSASGGGGGEIEGDVGMQGAQTIDERQSGGDFADRDGVQPNGAGPRPREGLGQIAETLAEMRAIGGAKKKAP